MSELPGQPTRLGHHDPASFGQHMADWATEHVGSWLFVALCTVWFVVWLGKPVEPPPYGDLTLAVSLLAIYMTCLVMISQKRQSERDRAIAERDDLEIGEIREINRELIELQREQTELTRAIHAHIEREGPAS